MRRPGALHTCVDVRLAAVHSRQCCDFRYPGTLRLSVRFLKHRHHGSRVSRQCRVPAALFDTSDAGHGTDDRTPSGVSVKRVEAVLPAVMALFHKLVDTSRPFHLTLMNVAVADFQAARPSHDLAAFFPGHTGEAGRKRARLPQAGGIGASDSASRPRTRAYKL